MFQGYVFQCSVIRKSKGSQNRERRKKIVNTVNIRI